MQKLFLTGAMTFIVAVLSLQLDCTVTIPPPPPEEMVVAPPPRPGAVWVRGHWVWRRWHHRYVWVPGHWKVRRHGVWVIIR
jgi:hypothetical protein